MKWDLLTKVENKKKLHTQWKQKQVLEKEHMNVVMLCRVGFRKVPHNMLLSKLESDGLDEWTGEELVTTLYPESTGQWLNVWKEISDKRFPTVLRQCSLMSSSMTPTVGLSVPSASLL